MSNYESGRSGRKRGHNAGIARAVREARRADAHVRRAQRLQRTTEVQLALLDERPGAALRERSKLAVAVQR